jgi:hypothetical protein
MSRRGSTDPPGTYRSQVKLPAVPRATQDGAAAGLVASRSSRFARPHRAEAQRRAVMRTAVADRAELSAHVEHTDLAAADTRDHAAVALDRVVRANVGPLAHAATRAP